MNENAWQRLARITYARMDHLGLTQSTLTEAGGPSSAWVRKLKGMSGHPSARMTRTLRELSVALGWEPNQARSLLVDDRTGWDEALLKDEERALIEDGHSPTAPDVQPASIVQRVTDMLRSDDMAGVSEAEWADLLEAIEAKMPTSRSKSSARSTRKTGS